MKIASRKKKMPSIANSTPNTSPKRPVKAGQRSPNSKERTVPVTAPTANVTATAFDQRCASFNASASSWRRPRKFAITIIAGKATPSDARMMWNPSVNAIWLRAASTVDASGRVSVSRTVPPRDGLRSDQPRTGPPSPPRVPGSSSERDEGAQHGTLGGRSHERPVAREDTGDVRGLRWRPAREATVELRVVDAERQRAGVDVDRDRVAVAHRGERPAARRLGRDVADHEPAGGAGEPAVGDERDRLAEAGADDRRGDAEHLAHPGAAGGALVADDEHVAGAHGAGAHGGGAVLLA